MALKDGFPSATGVADALDVRLGLAGLVVRDSSGNPRTGIFPRATTPIVVSTATMNSSIGPFEGIVSRSGQGAIFLPNDGATNVLHDAAPVSNKRLDLIYMKQNDAVSPNADANSNPVFGILKGTASASPTPYTYATAKAALAAGAPGAGAEPLAVVEIPSTATSMQSANVIYTQIHQYTAATGGVVLCRNTADRDAFSWVKGQHIRLLDADVEQVTADGSTWSSATGTGLVPLAPSVTGTGVSIDTLTRLITCSGTTTLSMAGLSGYRSYRIRGRYTSKSAGAIDFALRVMSGTTPETGANVSGVRTYWSGGATTTSDLTAQTYAVLEAGGLAEGRFEVVVASLNQALPTFVESSGSEITAAARYSHKHSTRHGLSTAYDGLQLLLTGAGTFNGEFEILGEG